MYFKVSRDLFEQIDDLIRNEEELYLKLGDVSDNSGMCRITYYDFIVLRDLFENTCDDEVLWNITGEGGFDEYV